MARFSIRDCLWLTLVVALAVAWMLERAKLARRADQLQATVELYRAYGLDRALEQLQSAPPRPATISVPAHRIRQLFDASPIYDYQLLPDHDRPWIERIERQVIEAERTDTNLGR